MFLKNSVTLLLVVIFGYAKGVIFNQHVPKRYSLNVPLNSSLRRSSYPYVSGDTFRSICNFIIDETQVEFDTDKMFDGAIIFVNGDYLPYFFARIHPVIKNKYILVTHNSIHSVPGRFAEYLADEKLVSWFGKNAFNSYSKMIPIPLGIANPHWRHGNIKIIEGIIKNKTYKKDKLLYVNFAESTHSSRKSLMNHFSKQRFSYVAKRKNFEAYLKDLAESYFVLSPQGTSIDCHRTWEALYVGCIPIVKHSEIDDLYIDLPVVIVDDWYDINEDFLQKKIIEFQEKEFNMEMLFANYWINRIKRAQLLFRR